MLKLCIEDEEGQETIVPIIRDEITIGRQEGNTIRLTERNVSRRHARLVREGDELWVEEISARYGTLKNGERIVERTSFRLQDQIKIGDYSLTLQSDQPAPTPQGGGSDFASESTAVQPLGFEKPRRHQEGTEILPAMPAKLVIISSNFAGQEFPLSRKQMIIGRGEDCDIIIDHRSVSQRHAKILRESGTTYQIVDLNSKNGIRIGGEKYTSTYIKRGDVVELGHVRFRFVEPGENYVFTPAPFEDDEPTQFIATPGKKTSNLPVLIGAAALLLVVLVGGIIAVASMSGEDATDPSPDALAVKTTPPGESDPHLASAAEDEEPVGNEKIAQGIERAREQLGEGDVEKAIGILEGLEYADPNAQEKERIATLLSQAKNERPFQDTYRSIRTNLDAKQHLSAIKAANALPSHTLFAKLANEKGLRDKALDGAMEEAQLLIKEGDRDEAKSLLDDLLELEQDYDPAVQLLASFERPDESTGGAVAVAAPRREDTSAPRKATSTKPKKKSKKKVSKKVSKEEARALHKQASSKVFSGDPGGAIEDCKVALAAGISDCHRVIALAYKIQGKNSKACRSFARSLKSSPSMEKGIRKQMEQLGCDAP